MKNLITSLSIILALLLSGCKPNPKVATDSVSIKDLAYEAFIFAYPLMEEVKTINDLFEYNIMTASEVVLGR